jgi:hypothetical protein
MLMNTVLHFGDDDARRIGTCGDCCAVDLGEINSAARTDRLTHCVVVCLHVKVSVE